MALTRIAASSGMLLALCISSVSCTSSELERGTSSAEDARIAQLRFLDEPEASRDIVLARFGPPTASFETGRIVSYAVFYDEGAKQLHLTEGNGRCFGLMIEYSGDGRIARHALIRRGSPRCPK